MKPEQLKLLADWYGYIVITRPEPNSAEFNLLWDNANICDYGNEIGFIFIHSDKQKFGTIWQPHKDSNQLDRLEDKMIREAKILQISIYLYKGEKIEAHYVIEGRFYYGAGKTKNAARLNAILNYVESK